MAAVAGRSPCERLDHFGCYVSVTLWRTFSPVYLVVGLAGNLTSFIILSRKRMCSTTTSVYLRMLAVADSLVLLTSVLRGLFRNYTFTDIRNTGVFGCKVHTWLSTSSVGLSCWLLSVIAVDRLISIKYPLWAKVHCTRKLSVIVGTLVITILVALNLHILIFPNRQEGYVLSNNITNRTISVLPMCSFGTAEYKKFYTKIWSVMILILYSILPIIFLSTCNIILFRAMATRDLQHLAQINDKQKQRDMRSVTKMLFVVCAFFITVTVPACISNILQPYIFDITSRDDQSLIMMCQTISACILYSNNTVNFFLYCLSGSLFRKELFNMLKELRTFVQQKINRRIHPEQSQAQTHTERRSSDRKGTSTKEQVVGTSKESASE